MNRFRTQVSQFSRSNYKIQFCIEYIAESELPHQSKIIFFNFSSNTWHRCISLVHCLFYRTSKKPFSQYREILFICNLPTLLLRTKKFDYQQRNGLIKKEMKKTKKIIHRNDRCSFITDMMYTYTMKWEWHWRWLEVPCYHWQIDRR